MRQKRDPIYQHLPEGELSCPPSFFQASPSCASPKLLRRRCSEMSRGAKRVAMTSTASIESLLEGLGLEDTPTYGDYVRGMLDDVDVASLDAQIDEVVAYLAEVLTLLRRLAILLVRCARCGQIRKPLRRGGRSTGRRRCATSGRLAQRRARGHRRRRVLLRGGRPAAASAEDEAAALKAATLALARRAGRPARNDLPTVDNKERERQKLKQVIKDHHRSAAPTTAPSATRGGSAKRRWNGRRTTASTSPTRPPCAARPWRERSALHSIEASKRRPSSDGRSRCPTSPQYSFLL